MNTNIKGFLYAIVAAVSYGTNPLFSLPLYQEGMNTDSILFYRYLFAACMLGLLIKLKGKSLALTRKEIPPLFIFGILFAASSLFLYESFLHMDAGIACTILFVYPVMVAMLMFIFFREKTSWLTSLCILMALTGIGLLYQGEGGKTLNATGMLLVMLSSLSYAVYMVGVNKSSAVCRMSTAKLTFYGLLFGSLLFIVRLNFLTQLQAIPSFTAWSNVLAIAFVPTVISLVCMSIAIHRVGSTLTAIVGALEPVTALFFGVIIFHETLTPRIIGGVSLILTAVSLIVLGKPLLYQANQLTTRIKQEYFRHFNGMH